MRSVLMLMKVQNIYCTSVKGFLGARSFHSSSRAIPKRAFLMMIICPYTLLDGLPLASTKRHDFSRHAKDYVHKWWVARKQAVKKNETESCGKC